jgi:lysophospholipase L1-like esterase
MNSSKATVLFILALISMSFIADNKKKIKVFLAGDSTISVKEVKAYPETGWGMPFAYLFDSTVTIDNRAKNGRSTRTFISEGLWENLIKDVQKDDYVFIQFGHNDESPEKVDRYTTPQQYKMNLIKFVEETRRKKAHPVLLTPVSRRKFKDGKQVETHGIYSIITREIASQFKVPLIELDKKSQELYQQFGEETSKLFFLQLEPGEHPNYPAGKNDNTHFNELGARKIAQIVLSEVKKLKLELADRIRPPLPVKP